MDGAFSQLYKNSLKLLVEKCEFIDSTFHIAYADDHITVVGLLVDKDMPIPEIQALILDVSDTCRDLLDQATKDIGCGINVKKSEMVVPAKYADTEKLLKCDFIWLGYSLHLTDDLFLQITPQKMIQRFETCRRLISDVFQYVDCPIVRRKVFQVYVAPVID